MDPLIIQIYSVIKVSASGWLFNMKFVTKHGHVNVKLHNLYFNVALNLKQNCHLLSFYNTDFPLVHQN
jgi:hypothetical protein